MNLGIALREAVAELRELRTDTLDSWAIGGRLDSLDDEHREYIDHLADIAAALERHADEMGAPKACQAS